jgi:TonB family protein
MRISQVGILNGFLGTIILHLLIGIIFFSAKISGMYSQIVQVQVETPTTIHEEEVEKEKQQHKKMSVDQMADAFIASHNRRNIGVNVWDKSSPVSDKEIQQADEDIDAANKQIADIQKNLDNQDKIIQSQTDEGQPITTPKKSKKIQGKLVVYKGPTNIYYDLSNRRDLNLYVPVYKCQGNGKVVVFIEVDKAGEVTDASIDKSQSETDDCLSDAAIDAAKRSTFNADFAKAPPKQKGTITYLFVAQ